jgi:hypothetical protein
MKRLRRNDEEEDDDMKEEDFKDYGLEDEKASPDEDEGGSS